eukprot:1158459-Pelagomonas_calceolata.AAC.4
MHPHSPPPPAPQAENAGGQSGAKGASAAPPSAAANGPAGQADGPKGTAGQQQQQQKGGDDANGAAKWTLEDEEEDEAAGVAPQGQGGCFPVPTARKCVFGQIQASRARMKRLTAIVTCVAPLAVCGVPDVGTAGTNANGGADNDEDDPLDAFMAGNARELTREEEEDRMRHQQAAQDFAPFPVPPLSANLLPLFCDVLLWLPCCCSSPGGAGDEEEDPLDAFMAATVMPKLLMNGTSIGSGALPVPPSTYLQSS